MMSLLDPGPPPPDRPTGGRRLALAAGAALALAVTGAGAWLLLRRPATPAVTTAPAPARSARPPRPRPSAPPPLSRPSTAATREPSTTLAAGGPRLRVESDVPGAQVFLDRRFVGNAPVDVGDVEAGTHHLNVSAEGHEMYSEPVEVGPGPRTVTVRFKEVRLDESVPATHKHGLGSCQGRLVATVEGLRYETSGDHAFAVPLSEVGRLEADYLAKSLRLKLRGGKTYNFTGDPAALLAFQKKVVAARERLGPA